MFALPSPKQSSLMLTTTRSRFLGAKFSVEPDVANIPCPIAILRLLSGAINWPKGNQRIAAKKASFEHFPLTLARMTYTMGQSLAGNFPPEPEAVLNGAGNLRTLYSISCRAALLGIGLRHRSVTRNPANSIRIAGEMRATPTANSAADRTDIVRVAGTA